MVLWIIVRSQQFELGGESIQEREVLFLELNKSLPSPLTPVDYLTH